MLVCHWPGIYFNGEKVGFRIFQEVVTRLHRRYDNLLWMKLSEISRYWAARELTAIERQDSSDSITLRALFAAPDFTLQIDAPATQQVSRVEFSSKGSGGGSTPPLRQVNTTGDLTAGTWCRTGAYVIACFDLPRGESSLKLG